MKDIFKIVTVSEKGDDDKVEIRLGIDLKIGDYEITCPISKTCSSYEALEIEVQAINNQIERILKKAKEIFSESSHQGGLDLQNDMTPAQIWSVLSEIDSEDHFIDSFNMLDETRRKEVAEYVLTKCNIFSGKASTFSSRYNNVSGLME